MLGPMPTASPETLETEALALLRELAGPDATFREHQVEAVTDLVDGRRRVLCVQRTGWGQSAGFPASVPTCPISSTLPSPSAFATSAAPIEPPAPGRLSTTTV